MNVKVLVLYSVEDHVHSGEVKGRWILFLTKNLISISFTGSAEQQRTTATGRIVDGLEPCLSGNHDF